MKQNIGSVDRTIRIIAGLSIIIVGLIAKSWWGAFGILPIFTAIVLRCPAYFPFGLSTIKKSKGSES